MIATALYLKIIIPIVIGVCTFLMAIPGVRNYVARVLDDWGTTRERKRIAKRRLKDKGAG